MSGSSGGTDVIRDFLVSIGYQERGREAFVSSLADVTKQAIKLGLEVKAAALAVTGAVAVIASGLESLYFASQRTGASVESIKAFGFAIGQMGGSVEGARASLENLGRFLRVNPGSEGFIQSLGVQTRTANGQLRDTGTLMGDLFGKLKAMPFFQANAYAGILGIDEKTLLAGMADVGEFSATLHSMYKAAGLDAQQAAKDSHGFMNELRTLGAAFGVLQEKVASALTKRMGDDIRRFRETLVANFKTISDAIVWVAEKLLAAAEVLTRLASRTVDAIRDISTWFAGLDAGSKLLIETFAGLLLAWRILTAGFLASPAAWVILGLGAAILLLYDDYKIWKAGGDSLIDWKAWEPSITAAVGAVKGIRFELGLLYHAVVDEMIPAFERLGRRLGLLAGDFKISLPSVADMLGSFKDLINELVDVALFFTAMADGDFKKAAAIGAKIMRKELAGFGIADPSQPSGLVNNGIADDRTWYERNAPKWAGGRDAPGVEHDTGPGTQGGAGPRGIRNNNPLNLSYVKGQIGLDPSSPSDGRFGRYTDMEGGVASGLRQLQLYQKRDGLTTVGAMIGKWAPKNENDTAGYVRTVAARMGIDPSTPFDINDVAMANKMIAAMARVETGREVDPGAISRGVARVLGGSYTPNTAAAPVTSTLPSVAPTTTLDMERLRGLIPGSLGGLQPAVPLGGGSVSNDNSRTNAPVLNQETHITVNGGSSDAARQVIDGQRALNQDLVRNFQGAAR